VDRAKKALEGVLQQSLLAPLSGEFHERFLAMFHAPGDRDAAKALRACVRQMCEGAVQEVMVGFDHQVAAITGASLPEGPGGAGAGFAEAVEGVIEGLELRLKELEESISV
jgi:D-mannonate dehydratase